MNGDTQHLTKDSILSKAGLSIRGVTVLMVVVSVCVLSAMGVKVEEPLYSLVSLTVGYYFGQQHRQANA